MLESLRYGQDLGVVRVVLLILAVFVAPPVILGLSKLYEFRKGRKY